MQDEFLHNNAANCCLERLQWKIIEILYINNVMILNNYEKQVLFIKSVIFCSSIVIPHATVQENAMLKIMAECMQYY